MTPDSGLQTYMFIMGAVMIGAGLYGIIRAAGIAGQHPLENLHRSPT